MTELRGEVEAAAGAPAIGAGLEDVLEVVGVGRVVELAQVSIPFLRENEDRLSRRHLV